MEDEIPSYDYRVQMIFNTELRKHLTNYADLQQIQVLKEEITRLRSIVWDLRRERNNFGQALNHYAPTRLGKPESDRSIIPLSIDSDDYEYH